MREGMEKHYESYEAWHTEQLRRGWSEEQIEFRNLMARDLGCANAWELALNFDKVEKRVRKEYREVCGHRHR